MALVNSQNLVSQFQGLSRLPALKQVGLLVGLAASVALGVAIVLWSQQPNYSLIYASMAPREVGNVLDALDKFGIPYRLDHRAGAVLVPAGRVHEARLNLATLGLPKSDVKGLELLDKDQTLGTSRMIETARYHRALAGELSRSIATLESVESARVHLAIPKQSVFVRNRQKPSASVLVNLYPGRELDETRLAGIIHLVASSIPGLEAEQVAVVDHKGRLLTESGFADEVTRSNARLKYTQQLEKSYISHILDILAPIVGTEGVRAQVKADIDFTSVEKTSESYNPDPAAIRSEQVDEQKSTGPGAQGIPGALTNQPPPAGTVAEPSEAAGTSTPLSQTRRSTRNYELDRTLAHSRSLPGTVQRLSVAVVVDYRKQVNKAGKIERVPLEAEEMDYINALVKETVGFEEKRGDTVNVINVSFKDNKDKALEPLPDPPLWDQPWLTDILKQVLGVTLVLFLILGVLRPVMKGLAEKGATPQVMALTSDGENKQLPEHHDALSLTNQQGDGQDKYEQQLSYAKSIVHQDPKRAAQLVNSWVSEDEA